MLLGQIRQESQDPYSKAFMMKLQAMMSYAIYKKVFDNVAAYIRVVELQKCVLPNVHCVFFLNGVSKQILKRAEKIDEFDCAETTSLQG